MDFLLRNVSNLRVESLILESLLELGFTYFGLSLRAEF